MNEWWTNEEFGAATGAICGVKNKFVGEPSTQATPGSLRIKLDDLAEARSLWVEAFRRPQDVTGSGSSVRVKVGGGERPLSRLEALAAIGNFSDAEIARFLGATRQSVFNWRKGVAEPRRRTARRLEQLWQLLKELSAVVDCDKIQVRYALMHGGRTSTPTPADLIAGDDFDGARRVLGLRATQPVRRDRDGDFVQLADLNE